jgi:hypothetical protein
MCARVCVTADRKAQNSLALGQNAIAVDMLCYMQLGTNEKSVDAHRPLFSCFLQPQCPPDCSAHAPNHAPASLENHDD